MKKIKSFKRIPKNRLEPSKDFSYLPTPTPKKARQINMMQKDVERRKNALPFDKIGGDWLLKESIRSRDFVPGKSGFKLDVTGGRSKLLSFGGNLDNIKATYDSKGSAQYKDLQGAIEAVNKLGGGGILIREGTHKLTDNITLYSNVSLIGENKYNTIIDCDSSDFVISAQETTTVTAGTVTLTKDDKTVTGSGTSWTSGVAGRYIEILGIIYEIASYTDGTNIELTTEYEGETTGGLSYRIVDFKNNIVIQNLTIKDYYKASSSTCLYLLNCINVLISNVIIDNATGTDVVGLKIHSCNNIICENIEVKNCESDGVQMDGTTHSLFSNIVANNNGNNGIDVSDSDYCQFINCRCNANNLNGFRSNSSDNVLFSNLEANLNDLAGLYVLNSSFNSIVNGNFSNNGSYGIYLNTSFYSAVSNCNVKQAEFSGILIDGSSYCTINGNTVFRSQNHGVFVVDDSTYNTIFGNALISNSQAANDTYDSIFLYDDGAQFPTYNVITSNTMRETLTNKCRYGVNEETSDCDYNIITSNIIQGHVTGAINNNGVNSVVANNI